MADCAASDPRAAAAVFTCTSVRIVIVQPLDRHHSSADDGRRSTIQ